MAARLGEKEWRAIAQGFDTKRAMKQMTSGLKHLHDLDLFYRDIKPRNLKIYFPLTGSLLRLWRVSLVNII